MDKKQKINIVLTGGHAGSTAFSVVEELNRNNKDRFEVYWLGTKYAFEGKKALTKEYISLPNLGVKFISVYTGRIQRKFTVWTIPSLLKIPFGFFHAIYLLLKIKPGIILSFGGFSAFPVVVVGWFLKVPIIIHEQTIVAGRANRYSSFFARKIALARKESEIYFPINKCVIVGNPMPRGTIISVAKKSLGNPPVIFIHGGSSGAGVINDNIEPILEKLLTNYIIIHQVGDAQKEKFKKLRENLEPKLKNKYLVYGIIATSDWSNIFRRADILVSRSGANIVSELIALKIPSLLIPIPFSYLDEQTKNAEFARDFGIATILNQENLTSERLLVEINYLRANWEQIVEKVKDKVSPDREASAKLVQLLKGELR